MVIGSATAAPPTSLNPKIHGEAINTTANG